MNENDQENTSGFSGFAPPTKNYFHMPNEWTNVSANIKSLAVMKLVEYVLRHTWGFHEYGKPKPITTDEFMYGRKHKDGTRMDNGTGLSNRSVIDGLREAVELDLLVVTIDTTDKGRISKGYALKMSTDQTPVKILHRDNNENTYEESSQQMCNNFTADMNDLHSRGVNSSHRTEKDTLERHFRKTLEEKQNSTMSNSSSDTPSETNVSSVISLTEKRIRLLEEKNAQLQAQLELLLSERTKASSKLSTSGQSVEKSASNVPGENSDPIATTTIKPEQQELLHDETPIQENTPPVMPPAEMKWCPEKLVQITEALRFYRNKQGGRFTAECTGKGEKSQRQRQLEAAKKIISRGVTELQYVQAYTKRNDAWWNDNKGSLTVVRMAENTPRKVMRTLEILEEMESQPSKEHRQYNATGKAAPSENSQHPTGRLVAATPGSQYIVDELVSRADDNLNAWLATPEGQAAMAEAEQLEAQQLAAVGGR